MQCAHSIVQLCSCFAIYPILKTNANDLFNSCCIMFGSVRFGSVRFGSGVFRDHILSAKSVSTINHPGKNQTEQHNSIWLVGSVSWWKKKNLNYLFATRKCFARNRFVTSCDATFDYIQYVTCKTDSRDEHESDEIPESDEIHWIAKCELSFIMILFARRTHTTSFEFI